MPRTLPGSASWQIAQPMTTALRQALDIGVVRIDASLRVVEANARAHALLGHRPDGLPGRSLMEAFMDPSVEGLAARAGKARSGSASAEIRSAGPDGPVLIGPSPGHRRWWHLARPRGRVRAASAPAHPDGVHRQPLARAADAAHHGQPPRRDVGARGGGCRRRDPREDARPDRARSRSRPVTSSRW